MTRRPALRLASALAIALVALLLAACLSGPPVQVAGGEVRNLSRATVHDVEALHHPTGAVAATNAILPGQSFALSFRTRELRAESATIRWRGPRARPSRRRCASRPAPTSCATSRSGSSTPSTATDG